MNKPAIAPIESIDSRLVSQLDPDGSLNLAKCLQCGRCSSGCTMRLETDVLPHKLVRMAQLGLNDELLRSSAIWVCASCHTCVSRCPMGVDTPALIDRLREMAEDAAKDADGERVRILNRTMLESMRWFGRVYELEMMGRYKLRARDLFSDLAKLPAMLLKGKMKLIPPRTRGRKAVASIFARVRRASK
jgi:heterodisulfide reductase subunit C2